MRRAALVGFQGFGNVGDEAILAGIDLLIGPIELEATELFGGPAIARTTAFPGARRHSPWRLLPTLPSLRALRRVDLLILSGGGLFNDHWWAVIPRYLAWVVAARMAGARVAWLGVGVGPIRRRPWRAMAHLAARLSSAVLVRDPASARLLGGVAVRARVVPDPSLFLEPPAVRFDQRTLGLIARPTTGGPAADERLLALLAALADAGRAMRFEPIILMMAPSVDRAFADELARRISPSDRVPIEELGPNPRAALGRLAEMAAVASVRLHGVLLAALLGVPCVPIAYDPKVSGVADQLGMGELVIDPDHPPNSVSVLLRQSQEEERRRAVAANVAALRARMDEVRMMVERA